ncbi:MAG: hypothetical protein U1B83_09460 [Candidatus Cloacimonadaceae bacterium]|nr:hypothetical protein [Candidatus Cloacimonadaceae bacterium]
MRNFMYLTLLAFAAIALFLSACGGSDNPVDPMDIDAANTNWHIMFLQIQAEDKAETYSISPMWLGDPTAMSSTDTFHIVIDNQTYSIQGYWMFNEWWLFGTAQLNPGQTYNVKFFKNNVQQCENNIKMPHPASATFPQNYSPGASASFSWNLSTDNQYQYAGVDAYKYVEGGEDVYDDYIKSISPSARSFTVPANSVQNLGAGTDYSLMVMQLNYARSGRNVMTAYQGQYSEYTTKNADTSVMDQILRARRIVTQFKI